MVSTLRQAIALLMVLLTIGISSCGGNREVPVVLLADEPTNQVSNVLAGAISEVSPPERIQQLKPYLDVYEPQVRIATPHNQETLSSTTIEVTLQVRDFPIYKDKALGFGPHLHLFLDGQPHQTVYDADAPITLDNLAPGTHTLRLLAVRPWGESFKNEGAYDQVTFNVFADSPQNNPDDSQPLLTHNQPQDFYGAEPILLDFYLSNAPLHLVAQADETVSDWRIRCTVNGESFVFDRWQPIYLKGFRLGKNWIKLELIDENGNLIDNALNTNIRVIDYQPGGNDGLSRLVRGEIPLDQAKVLIDPNYEPPTLTIENPGEAGPETIAEPQGATGETDEDAISPSEKPTTSSAPAAEAVSDQDSAVESAPTQAETDATSTSDRGADVNNEVELPASAIDANAPTNSSDESNINIPKTDMLSEPEQETPAVETMENSTDQTMPEELSESRSSSQASTTDEVEVDAPGPSDDLPATTSDDDSSDLADERADDLPLSETTDAAVADEASPESAQAPTASEGASKESDTAVAAEDAIDLPSAVDETDTPNAPETNLKTLQDNADII
ncbi:MAG: hypothetical protein AAF892_01730 [Cyanobacteria bacterium P01_D01_bin.71]